MRAGYGAQHGSAGRRDAAGRQSEADTFRPRARQGRRVRRERLAAGHRAFDPRRHARRVSRPVNAACRRPTTRDGTSRRRARPTASGPEATGEDAQRPGRAAGRSDRSAHASGSSERQYAAANESSTRRARSRRAERDDEPTARDEEHRADVSQSRTANANGVAGSSSKPSQPSWASCARVDVPPGAAPAWITSTNGAREKRTPAAARPQRRSRPAARRRPARRRAGRRAIAPGYFADAASPAATPAHSSRPVTSSASAHRHADV